MGTVFGRLGRVADAEELYLSNTASVHVPYTLAPFHKGNLNVVVALNRHEICILVAIPQLQQALTDAAVREPRELCIDSINERLVCDVESDNKRDIVTRLAIDSHLELSR